MIERLCREHGLTILMMVAVLAMQIVFSYGRLETAQELSRGEEKGWTSPKAKWKAFEKTLMPNATKSMPSPLAFFALVVGVVLLFGVGLVADAIFLMQWILASSRGNPFFKSGQGRSGPWEVEDFFKLLVLFFFAASCLHSFLYIVGECRWVSRGTLDTLGLVLSSLGLYGLVLSALAFLGRKKDRKTAGFLKPVSWKEAAEGVRKGFSAYLVFVPPLAFLLFVSLLVCQLFGVEPQPHELVEILRQTQAPVKLVYLGVLTMVMGPVVEEIVFRGVAYSALRKRLGVVGAAGGSALIFALAHGNAAQTLPIFGMGMVLALLYEHTGNLIAPMAFHAVNNTLAFVLTMFVVSTMK